MSASVVPLPKGFSFATAAAGFKHAGRDDLALIVSDTRATAAGVFTKNLFQAAPVLVARDLLDSSGGHARAVMVNSGQANACTGQAGIDDCRATQAMVAGAVGLAPEDILPASTASSAPGSSSTSGKRPCRPWRRASARPRRSRRPRPS
jgi:glutamate N-acetyltransferase/amino-acid N-acetyltransferase